jgi:hypothetical protein
MRAHHVEVPHSPPRVTSPGIACESEEEKEGNRSASEATCNPPSTTTPSQQGASPPSRIQQLIEKICPELQRITQAQSAEELHQICGFDCDLAEIEEALNVFKVDATDARARVNRLTDVVSSPAYSTDSERPLPRAESPPPGPRTDNIIDSMIDDPEFQWQRYYTANLGKPSRTPPAVPPSFSPLAGDRGLNIPIAHPTLHKEFEDRELRDLLIHNNCVVRVAKHISPDLEGPDHNMFIAPCMYYDSPLVMMAVNEVDGQRMVTVMPQVQHRKHNTFITVAHQGIGDPHPIEYTYSIPTPMGKGSQFIMDEVVSVPPYTALELNVCELERQQQFLTDHRPH